MKHAPLIGLLLVLVVAALGVALWRDAAPSAPPDAARDSLPAVELAPRSWSAGASAPVTPPDLGRDVSAAPAERAAIAQRMDEALRPDPPTAPSSTLEVEVVDALGIPLADVAVTLLERDPGRGWRGAASARTDASGRAELPAGAAHLERSVQPALVDAAPAEVAIAPHATWPAAVRFAATATGALEVRVLGLDDRPVEDELTVWLWREDGRASSFAMERADRRTTTTGAVRFEHVALDGAFTVRAQGAATRFRSSQVTGPLRPGETVRCDVLALAPDTFVQARLVGEDGAPLRAREVQLVASRGDAFLKGVLSWSGVTDAEGRLRIPSLPSVSQPDSQRALRLFAAGPDGATFTGALVGGTLSELSQGRQLLEFGDVELAPADELITGRVLDAAGSPIAGASVLPYFFDRSRLGEIAVWPSEVSTGADGAFAFVGDAAGATFALMVSAPGFASANVRELRGGARDVEVLLEPRGIVRGRVRMPDALSADLLEVRLEQTSARGETRMFAERPGSHPSAANSITADVGSDGAFESLRVAPGAWRLEVRLKEETLLAMHDLAVAAGAVLDLGQLDLRQLVTPLHIDVVDERGEPLRGALVSRMSDAGAWPTELATTRAGRASFLTLGSPVDLRVWTPGRRSLELPRVSSDLRVTLPLGLPVHFAFPAELPPIEPPLEFVLTATDQDAESLGVISCFVSDWRTEHLATTHSAPVRARDRWTLHLPHAGDYMLLCSVRDARSRRNLWTAPRPLGPIALDAAHPATVALDLDLPSLTAALAARSQPAPAPVPSRR